MEPTRDPARHRITLAASAICLCVVASCATPRATAVSGHAERAAPAIDAGSLARELERFAHDSMRGREAGTVDANRAAFFIGNRLAELGVEPVGDSLYYQRVPMVRQVVASTTRITVSRANGARSVRVGDEVVPMLSLGEGQPEPRRAVDAPMVFAGGGDFASVDLLNKVAVVLHGAPPGATGALRDSLNSDSELGLQLARIALGQPAGIVVLMTPDASKLYRQLYPSLMRDVRGQWAGVPASLNGLELPMLLFGEARRGSPFLPAGWPEDDSPQELGTRLTATIDVRRETFTGYNVIGRVPGTDPQLRSTYVTLGAHYDHVGVLPAVEGDSIANGADDNGSGTVALLAMAGAMVRQPSRRSTLFIWHAAEEKGLLGSSWFTAHPTVPLDSVVAMLNVDMIGRNSRDSLYIVGPGAAPNGLSARLGSIIDSVNSASPAPMGFDRSWDLFAHPEQFYQRSDHFNYAKRGVPVAFFTSGMHPQYHDVGDDAGRIDYEKMRRVTELLVAVTRAIGNDANRPR